jgi:hypothetical protein
MYYTLRVTGKKGVEVVDASVTVNGKFEGRTDEDGLFVVRYAGEDIRAENLQVFKEGEHIWQKPVEIYPNLQLNVELNKMLLIDLHAYTENYDVIQGIAGTRIYLNDLQIGRTGRSGYFGYRYENEEGVGGLLELRMEYPDGYYPESQVQSFDIVSDLPRLSYSGFSYRSTATAPRVAVMPPSIADGSDVLLSRRTYDLKRGIEDYLSLDDVFIVVSEQAVSELFKQFEIEISKEGLSWGEIPFLKNAVDGVIFGEMTASGSGFRIKLFGIDYTGEIIGQLEDRVSLRELDSIPEIFVDQFRGNYPFEGTISAIEKGISINLGSRHGIEQNDKFYSFVNYYDEVRRNYAKRRVAKLRITDVESEFSIGELESISEGYLLEPGGRVKRFSEPVQALREFPITLSVTSGREPLPGANIYLDDQWAGQTDEQGVLQFVMTESSTADVLVYKEGFIPEKIELRVQEGKNVFPVRLKQGRTQLTIDSEPQGALLFINGEFRGNTPFIKEPIVLPYGFHRIELKLEGYKDFNQYVKFSQRRISFTGSDKIVLYEDFYQKAEKTYEKEKYERTLKILESVPEGHPDYKKSMEFIGYIYLRDFNDPLTAIDYYGRVLDLQSTDITSNVSIVSYYNYGQACFNLGEELYYDSRVESQRYFMKAVEALNVVRERKARVQSTGRRDIYQDVLFYTAVSYQKLYYLTGVEKYLTQARYSWIDYFDFFDNNFFKDPYFEKQYRIAESYRKEVQRLQSEE